MYFTCDYPDKFLPEVTEALTAFENRLIAEQQAVHDAAGALFDAGRADLATAYLTDYSRDAGREALLPMSELDYERVDCRPASGRS